MKIKYIFTNKGILYIHYDVLCGNSYCYVKIDQIERCGYDIYDLIDRLNELGYID